MMAQREKAHITHVQGWHPSMIQHPDATVEAIMTAIQSSRNVSKHEVTRR
jgi:hypothetical protein